jgi:cytochrome bd-type quinol oxidase subunit 1
MMMNEQRQEIVHAFYRMRQMLGYLGMILPFTLIVGGLLSIGDIAPSISDYYHTILRDVFVGTMMAIGLFLICYTGYRREGYERVSDDWVTTLAGVFALGVALFPNEIPTGTNLVESVPQLVLGTKIAAYLHYLSALLFLTCLGYISLFKFARTANPVRRRIYTACGLIIVASIIGTVIASWFRVAGSDAARAIVNDYRLILWFEAVGVWAFSVSWLTKGRADLSIIKGLRRPAPSGG